MLKLRHFVFLYACFFCLTIKLGHCADFVSGLSGDTTNETGTVNAPLTFSFLKQFSFSNPPQIMLPRKESVQQAYDQHRQLLARQNKSITEYLLEALFFKDDPYVFTSNPFPYYMEEGLCHDLLWINPQMSKKKMLADEYYVLIKQKFGQKEVIFFENSKGNKSIERIHHVHLFYKADHCVL